MANQILAGSRTGTGGEHEPQVNVGRKYKSRKERPCDACRKRKICCTRDAYEKDCSLCKTRGESCKYVLPPNVRRNRQPGAVPTPIARSRTSSSSTTSIPPRPVVPRGTRSGDGSVGEWICQFVGLSGDQDPWVLRHCSFNALNYYKAPDWAVLRIKGYGDTPLQFTVVPDTHLDARPDYYPTTDTEAIVRPHSEDLLRTYFEVVHQSYPLLDPSRFNGELPTNDPLLAVMYNLAAPFSQETQPFFPELSDFVHQALPIERRHARLETIEAALLHLQRHTTIHRAPTLPGLVSEIGSLVGMAHDLGLNLDPSSWSLSAEDSNRRIRIWWGIYIQDKWSALGLGRPSYLNDDHCNVPLPTVGNFSPIGDPKPALQFVAMAHLTTILSDILNTFYTLASAQRIKNLSIDQLCALLEEFQGRLNAYNEQFSSRSYENNNTLLDSSGTLILSHHTLHLILLRAILRTCPLSSPLYPSLRYQTKSILTTIVDFLSNLSVSKLRAFWWSPVSRINFAMAGTGMFYQLLTSVESEDIEFWSATIGHYRSLLRLQSRGWDVPKLACVRLDLLARGMGVDVDLDVDVDGLVDGEGQWDEGLVGGFMGGGDEVVGRGGGRKLHLPPGSAEEWIARQGHEGMLLC